MLNVESVVALSGEEAEFMATCAMKCLFLSKLINELLRTDVRPVTIHEDNQSYIHMANTLETMRRINSAKEDITHSTFYKTFVLSLTKYDKPLQAVDIVCYGIGQFSDSVASRFQLALLLVLKDCFKSKVSLYDPVLSPEEKEIIELLDCLVIETNEEGKRKVDRDTLFFVPHCPKQLVNNLLWKNWGKSLSQCIIIGNSFRKIFESNSNRFLEENLVYIFHASSVVTEIEIDNNFKFSDIFNDLSIHYFLKEEIDCLSDSILNFTEEPIYQKEDIEFVTSSFSRNLNLF